MKTILCSLLACLLAGCVIPHSATSHHNLRDGEKLAGAVVIESAKPGDGFRNIQEDRYSETLAVELAKHEMRRVPDRPSAKYVIAYTYDVTSGGSSIYSPSVGKVATMHHFLHYLEVRIFDPRDLKNPIWKGESYAGWGHADLSKTFDGLAKTLFNDFPGPSGLKRDTLR